MLPTEQAKFFEAVQRTLNAYGKFPEQRELEAWWYECSRLSLDALEVALKSHRADPDRGERAPRPVDITRRMKTGARTASQCAAVDPSGRCEYPGIFSDGTMGEGPWYCPWHRQDRVGPEASHWIDVSRNVPWERAREKHVARFAQEALRAPAVIATTADLAKGRRGNLGALLARYDRTEDAA